MNWQALVVYAVLALCVAVLWRKLVFNKKHIEGKKACPYACHCYRSSCACSIRASKG